MARTPPPAIAGFAAWPERHPGPAFLILILLAMIGAVGAPRLALEPFALPSNPLIHIQVSVPGIDAGTLEATFVEPLEAALARLPGSERIESRVRAESVDLILRFATPLERDRALPDARQRAAAAMEQLQISPDALTVGAHDSIVPAAAVYVVVAESLSTEVVQWAERGLADPLRELPEVASVTVAGAIESEILIQPDVRRLAALGLAFDDIVQALRRRDEAPRRRMRRAVVVPGSAESIATRAVRLASGEPIALAEVARIATIERRATEPPLYRDAPALRLAIFPRVLSDAARIAERSRAHLAWLRANDLVPPGVSVQALHDESQVLRQWLKQVAQRVGIFFALTLVVTVAIFGARRCGLLVCALVVWAPAVAALLWATGFSLNAMTVAGLMLACIPLALMIVGTAFGVVAMLAVGAAALCALVAGGLDEYEQIAHVFALSALLGVVVAWLLLPWTRTPAPASPLVRFLPSRWRSERGLPMGVLAAVMLIAAIINVRALSTAGITDLGGAFVMRVHGKDADRLTALSAEALVSLRATPGVESVVTTATLEEGWRLQLDPSRAEEFGIGLTEIGRAFAIAREGLLVGAIMYGDTPFRLRVQLPENTAGDQYERLLLRGESRDRRAVYLRDVGIALRELQPRERLRIDGEPAVEITARWRTLAARTALDRYCKGLTMPGGYARDCVVVDRVY